MKTILVLAQHPDLAEAVRAAVNPENYRVVHRLGVEEAEPLLSRNMLDACLLDVELAKVQGMWAVEKLRRKMPQVPLLVYSGAQPWEWEEEAYLQGVAFVLAKPVRPRMLNALLDRVTAAPVRGSEVRPVPVRTAEPATSFFKAQPTPTQALEVLRDFSAVLTHSLCAEALLKQFLMLLREILGVNRATVFLRQPVALFAAESPEAGRCLRSACAIGLQAGLLEHFELSFESGIGGFLFAQGRILRRDSAEAAASMEIQKEFELLGAQVAIPMLDRETLVGVALFDGRVTGEPLANGELELIFHLLEELGLAVKNIWLHDQLAANHEMMADILRELSSACVVVNRDLSVIHANKAARHLFARPGRRNADLEFSDLPQILGSKVYQVLKTGAGIATFKYEPADSAQNIYHVTVVPFQGRNAVTPNSVLLVIEDFTQTEQLKRLEIEANSLRLIRSMADRLAHEIGNAMVPLSTHQQLLAEKYKDPGFRASLDDAMADSVKRVTRLVNQMRFLARDSIINSEAVPLGQVIEEAYREAQKHNPAKDAKFVFEPGSNPIVLSGDHAGLKHALSEVMLNALQANPAKPVVEVRAQATSEGNGSNWVQIEIADNGTGFSAEAAQKAPTPFFTTRNVGLGLGLCVCRKIVETHRGTLQILVPKAGQPGVVRISLPLSSAGDKSGNGIH